MMRVSCITVSRLLMIMALCLVPCLVDFSALAQPADYMVDPVTTPEVEERPEQIVIEVKDVESSIESYLEAIAINGVEIPPTPYPEAMMGDVITFRARILNTYPGTLRLLKCGADWGQGLVYQGNLTGNYVNCRYDEGADKISADIEEIPGDPGELIPAGEQPADTDRWYTFDLKVIDCNKLSINIYTDELYSCQSLKTYYVAPKIEPPGIHYSVSISAEEILAGKQQPVTVSFINSGKGAASSVILESNLDKFFVTVSDLSPDFVYDAEAGLFMTGRSLAPGETITLDFNLVVHLDGHERLPAEMIMFRPVYADVCGLRFKGRETMVMLRPPEKRTPDMVYSRDRGTGISLQLPDVGVECETDEAVVTITRSRSDKIYDLTVELDTDNYAYLGNLATTGFDGRTPEVNQDPSGQVVFSFDNDPLRAEPVTEGGTLRFSLGKKCARPADLKATVRFADQLSASRAIGKTPDGGRLNIPKKEISVYARPLLYRTQDLELRVTPECCRFDPGIPMKWNIYVTNQGNATATGVVVRDVLPENVVFQPIEDENSALPEIEADTPFPGQTTLTWHLGDITPSRSRKATVVALVPADQETFGLPVNNIRLTSGCAGDTCYEQKKAAPCLLLPDECLEDVYEKPEIFHGFLALALVYKSNLYQTYENPTNVWATYITPGIWVALPASHERLVEIATTSASPGGLAVSPFFPKNDRRYQAYFLYSPQLEIYHHENQNNMVTHRVDSYFHYNTRNKFKLQFIDQFKRGHDSISSRAFTVEDKYRTNLFSLISEIELTKKFEVRLDYSNFLVDYDASENLNDRDDNSWALYGYFKLTPRISLFAEYEYADLDYKDYFLDSVENRYFGGIRWEFTEKTSGQLKGGYGRRDYDASILEDTGTWMAELVLDYDMTEKTRIVANAYRRYEEAMGLGLIGESYSPFWSTHLLTHMVGLSIDYHLTRKLHFNLHSSVHFDEHAYEYDEELWYRDKRRDTEYAISPKIKFDFLKWLTFDLSYTYTNKTSNYSDAEYEDHTAFIRGTIYR